jgi:2'-5' RNA ligase
MPNEGFQDTISLLVSLKFTQSYEKYFLDLSREFSEKGNSLYFMDGKNFFPHLTLYSFKIPVGNIDKVKEIILEEIKDLSTIKAKIYPPKKGHDGYVISFIKPSGKLQALHETLVARINPLRENLLSDTFVDTTKYDDEKKSNLERYGNAFVMDRFEPHVTLVRYETAEEAFDALKSIHLKLEEVELDRISLSSWTLTNAEKIFEIQLKNK